MRGQLLLVEIQIDMDLRRVFQIVFSLVLAFMLADPWLVVFSSDRLLHLFANLAPDCGIAARSNIQSSIIGIEVAAHCRFGAPNRAHRLLRVSNSL